MINVSNDTQEKEAKILENLKREQMKLLQKAVALKEQGFEVFIFQADYSDVRDKPKTDFVGKRIAETISLYKKQGLLKDMSTKKVLVVLGVNNLASFRSDGGEGKIIDKTKKLTGFNTKVIIDQCSIVRVIYSELSQKCHTTDLTLVARIGIETPEHD